MVPGVGVEPMMTLRTRKLLIPQPGKNHKSHRFAKPRYTGGTRVSSSSPNPSAYIAKCFYCARK
jgi:hypothetical protein